MVSAVFQPFLEQYKNKPSDVFISQHSMLLVSHDVPDLI
jgi:hypothetical protein